MAKNISIDESQASRVRDYVSSLPKEEQTSFLKKYNSLSSEDKSTVVSRLLSNIPEDTSSGSGDTVPALAGLVGLAALGAGGVVTGKLMKPLVEGIKTVPTVVNYRKKAKFAEELRKSYLESHKKQTDKFANDLKELSAKNPNTMVNITDVVNEITTNPDMNQQTKYILKKTPKLGDFLENRTDPAKPVMVSLEDAQNIVNHINDKVPGKIKYSHLDLLDTVNSIRDAQLSSFPDLEGTRNVYAEHIEPYKSLKGYFKVDKILKAIDNDFGGSVGMANLEKILPKDVLNKIRAYKTGNNIVKPIRNLSGGMLGGVNNAVMPLQMAQMMMQGGDASKAYPNDKIRQLQMMAGVIGNPEEQKRKFIEWQNQNIA